MAIWDGGTLNTNALASMVTKYDSLNYEKIIVKRNALFYAMLGMSYEGGIPVPNWNSLIKKDYQVQGNNLTVRLLGELETYTTLADANQYDAVSWDSNDNAVGAAQFAWTHYSKNFAVQDSDYDLIKGNEARTVNFSQEVMDRLIETRRDILGTAVNSTNDQARTTLGGWEYAIDSSGTYGTLTRAGQNPNWSANETSLADGDGGLDDIDAMRADIDHDGGNPSLGLAPKVPYNKLKQELRGYAQAVPTSWTMYEGGALIHYDGTTFALEDRCTATVVGMLDPSTFRFYRKGDGSDNAISVMGEELMMAILKGAKLGFALREWTAFINRNPGKNGKITNWVS